MWAEFDSGKTINTQGSENGRIIRDDEHSDGARITLEQDTQIAPFAITCGIYGWMVHTRFFSKESEANDAFDEMKDAIANIVNLIPLKDDADDDQLKPVTQAIHEFVERYP
jgi:hypothetical protein